MRLILFNTIIIFLLIGCIQNNEINDKSKTQNQFQKDSFKLKVLKDEYLFSYQGKILEAKNEEQLSVVLRENYNMLDTLYVFIGDTHSEKIGTTLVCLRNLKIKKRAIIVEDDYFRFPYPKE